jgi:hypothetical protein
VAFVLPGFVTLLISERTHAVRDTSSAFDRLLLALYYSVLTYALLALIAWIAGYDRNDIVHAYKGELSVGKILLYAVLAILALPALLATSSRLWLKADARRWFIEKSKINPSHRTPSAWDHFFEQGKEAFVRATLSDGRVVGGYYGPGSFATYGEQARDLFISNQWELDDDAWFKKPAEASLGMWLAKESVVSFEVYAVERDDEREDASAAVEADREEGRISAAGYGTGALEASRTERPEAGQ